MWTVLRFVPAFCVALLISGCDGSDSSPVGISTEWNEAGYEIRRLTDNAGTDESPSWSPDGRSIAFASDRDGTNGDIYVMDADGDNVRRLTNHTSQDATPSWSPDGRFIAFASSRDGNPEIYVMDASGSNVRRLTNDSADDGANDGAWDWSPSWSPDGHIIAFTSDRDGSRDIYAIDASGDNLRNLTNHPSDDEDPSWSPDGHTIAFASDRDGASGDIYVMDADGGNVRRLTNHTSQDGDPSWSPDGRSIAFFSLRDDSPEIAGINPEIYVMDADGSNVRRLTNHNAWDYVPSWSPDSHFIAFASNRGDNRDVYVIEGFGRSNRGRRP